MNHQQCDFVLRTLEHAPGGPLEEKAITVCMAVLDIMLESISEENAPVSGEGTQPAH